jgi:hypothetical protein
MLKLLLVTLGTWSGISVFLVGALGFLVYLREQRACAVNGNTGAKLPGAAGGVAPIARTR